MHLKPVGVVGGYDGDESDLSDTPLFAAFGSSYRSCIFVRHTSNLYELSEITTATKAICLTLRYSQPSAAPTGPVFRQTHLKPVGVVGGYDGDESGLSEAPLFAAFGTFLQFLQRLTADLLLNTCLGTRSGFNRTHHTMQVERRVDDSDMAECLRKVTQHAFFPGVVLLGQQAQVVA